MGVEFVGVFVGNVVLVGIVFEDYQVGYVVDEVDLVYFFFEMEEEQDVVVV